MTTLSQLKELSTEELRCRVAESVGWTFIEKLAYTGIPKGSRGNADARVIPDYATSLDCMASAEKTLSDSGDRIAYQNALYELSEKDPSVSGWHWTTATARDRAIAFLAVRWREG